MTTIQNSVQSYLTSEVEMVKKLGRNPIGLYISLGDFVLQNGRAFTPRDTPENIKCGKPKQCYHNATILALSGKKLIYCEGYAMGVIPVMHAWCVDAQGNVIDPTWTGRGNMPELGTEYFGVPFDSGFLHRTLLRVRRTGIIDAWEERWPVLRAKREEFIHPLFSK